MPEADPLNVARSIALARLTARAHSVAELRAALLKKGTAPEVAEEVIERFGEVGLLDDSAFAEAWVESRVRTRGSSARVLRLELQTKGVDREIIDAALADVDAEVELEAARHLANKKVPSLRGVDRQVAYRRLSGMLARRGYRSAVVSTVVQEALVVLSDDLG